MRRCLVGMAALCVCAAVQAQPELDALILLGSNANAREILVDPTSLRSLPPAGPNRPFAVVQLYVVMRGPPPKGSTEKVRYNFHCRARTAAPLSYYRVANGRKSHDWRGADIIMKYRPVDVGGLVEMALGYACSGGKLPQQEKRTAPNSSDDETREEDGG